MYSIDDFETYARETLGKGAWDYYSSGANHELTLKDNIDAFQRYRLRPRVLRDVSRVDTALKVLGETVAFPILVGATAMHGMAHPDGEAATARACSRLDTCMALSFWSNTTLEDVAKASSSCGMRWFQLNFFQDPKQTELMIRRVEKAGYKALIVSVDAPALGRRLSSLKNKFNPPKHLELVHFRGVNTASATRKFESGVNLYFNTLMHKKTWDTISWLCRVTHLPVVLKGILRAEDALEAVRRGAQGIIVSNHGARQLDGTPATIDALGEVVKAVSGKVEVFLDGGVRQGTDVLKALAIGAKAVFIGRPVLWGLTYKGCDGVEEVLGMLRDELRLAMMLSGCAKLSDITPNLVIHESYYKQQVPSAKL